MITDLKLPKSYIKIIFDNIDYFNENSYLIKKNEEEYFFPFESIYRPLRKEDKETALENIDNFVGTTKKLNDDEKEQVKLFDELIISSIGRIKNLEKLFSENLIEDLRNSLINNDENKFSSKLKIIKNKN